MDKLHGGMEERGMACLGKDKCSEWGEGGKFDERNKIGVQSSALLAFE